MERTLTHTHLHTSTRTCSHTYTHACANTSTKKLISKTFPESPLPLARTSCVLQALGPLRVRLLPMVLSLLQSGVDNQRDAPSPTKWWCTVSFKVEWTIIHAPSPSKWSGQSYMHCLLQSGVDNHTCTVSYKVEWTINVMHRLLQSGGAHSPT